MKAEAVYVSKQQLSVLVEHARRLVNERYQRLCSLSDPELLKLKQTEEQVEIDGVRVALVTHTPKKEHPAFGVLAEVWTLPKFWRWRGAGRRTLAHEAFWFVEGERQPFAEEDYW